MVKLWISKANESKEVEVKSKSDAHCHHHITCWNRYCPRRRSWPDLVWSLSLPCLAILFDHMHPLSPVHFSSSHSLPAFSTFSIVFFDIQGIVHFEFLPQGQTVNQTVYKEILRRLVRSVHDKRRSFWKVNAWALYHDNASAHTALSICQFLAEKNIATLEHPPYSPDLAPCDFFLFPKIKSVLKGTHFSDIDSIKKAVMTGLKKILENAFQEFLNYGKIECTSVYEWKGITLKDFDFGIFQYFSINFLYQQSRYFSDTPCVT